MGLNRPHASGARRRAGAGRRRCVVDEHVRCRMSQRRSLSRWSSAPFRSRHDAWTAAGGGGGSRPSRSGSGGAWFSFLHLQHPHDN